MARWFRRWYGAEPLHLLALLGALALAGLAAYRLVPDEPRKVLAWFVGAVVVHDLILFPLYALADRSLTDVVRHRRTGSEPARLAVNHIRFPVLMSGLLLLMWFPLILGMTGRYQAVTGLTTDVYLGRWLAVSAALFVVSAAAYAIRLRRSGVRPTP